jgi:diadenosine tetraphosphatase ApaH/serine/threonine PP2A family protein phosphatase
VALEAVLADIQTRPPDRAVFAGDLVFGGPEPAACLDRVRTMAIPCIRGNTDEWFAAGRRHSGEPLIDWGSALLDGAARAWLGALPFEYRLDDLLVVHATPWSVSDLVPRNADEALIRRILAEGRAKAVVYGHIHQAWVGDVPGAGLLVNAGSVGFPFDGDARASYAVLTRGDGGWAAELRRVPYDVDTAAAAFPRDHPQRNRWMAMMRRASRDV